MIKPCWWPLGWGRLIALSSSLPAHRAEPRTMTASAQATLPTGIQEQVVDGRASCPCWSQTSMTGHTVPAFAVRASSDLPREESRSSLLQRRLR